MVESYELAKKVKEEAEKRLDEAQQEKKKFETNLQEKLAELESLRTENERVQAEQISFTQVENYFCSTSIHFFIFKIVILKL